MSLNVKRGVALFTDGSCYYKDRSGGWAWAAIDAFGNEEVGSGSASGTTNNRMEMEAWVQGLTHLHERYRACEILVYCDSEYVGLGAMNEKRSRKKNKDLWRAIDEAMELHEYVEFVHVKGHRDSHYNNLVDEMAGHARKAGTS